MPFYWKMKYWKDADRRRAIDSLRRLRAQLRRDVPRRTAKDTLLLATWNIRDFDSNKFGHGPRLKEAFYYIAEVISHFDMVAVQEINADLDGLEDVVDLLGPGWNYLVTDLTEGRSGNKERMAYVYDTRKVTHQHVAGEIVLPPKERIDGERQFARTPFLAAFQAGWLKFNLCTVHLYFGENSGLGLQRRIEEIDHIGAFLKKRYDKEHENFVLLGDMNIVRPDHATMEALTQHDFQVPIHTTTNVAGTKYYDQIAFLERHDEIELGDSSDDDGEPMNAGSFRFFNSVYRVQDAETYHPLGKKNRKWPTTKEKRKKYFKTWRTFQVSDHQPLWVELKIDFTDKYLKRIREL